MASKTPRKPRKAAAPKASGPKTTVNPVLLALAAVAAVFAVGFGATFLIGRHVAEPTRSVAQLPTPTPPAPKAEPAPVVTEPEPGLTAEEEEAPPPAAPEPPPKPAMATLPPPTPVAPTPPASTPPGTPLWKKNAVPAKLPADKPAIAIVIDDMGVDRKRSARTVTLPAPLTLAWLPYAQDLSGQARAARAAGHELLLHIPMEPSVQADPGPDALLVKLDKGEILRRAKAALDSFDGYVGVNNHMGSRFTADHAAMAPVLAEIARRGLLWLDSRTTPKTAGPAIAQDLKMPHVGRDVFLDNEMTVASVRAQLAKTEQVARHQGFAIAIGHPHDATIEALASWLPEMQKRGFVLVPVSAVVRARQAGG